MSGELQRSTIRGLKAAILAFVATAVLIAAVLPSCGELGCCARDADTSVHRAMPCCEEPSIASREHVRVLPATSTGSVPPPQKISVPVTVVAAPVLPAAGPASAASNVPAHREPESPLFLLNEQFRI